MTEIFVIAGSLLAIIGNLPYIRDVIKGNVKPHPYTWFVWSLVSCIVFFGALEKGAGLGTIPILASEIFTVLIFLFSLKNGFKKIRKVDNLYLATCLLGLIPWYLTQDPTISVVIAVSIDLLAFIPTIRKTWDEPQSENAILYFTNFVRHILIMFSLGTYNIATTLHSIAMIVTNLLMTFLIYLKPKLFRK